MPLLKSKLVYNAHQYWQEKLRILINFFVKEKLVEIVIKDPILHHLVLSLYIRGVYFLGIIVRKSLIDFSSLNCWKLLIFNFHNMTAVLNKITCPRLYHCAIQHIQFTILDRCSEPKKNCTRLNHCAKHMINCTRLYHCTIQHIQYQIIPLYYTIYTVPDYTTVLYNI